MWIKWNRKRTALLGGPFYGRMTGVLISTKWKSIPGHSSAGMSSNIGHTAGGSVASRWQTSVSSKSKQGLSQFWQLSIKAPS